MNKKFGFKVIGFLFLAWACSPVNPDAYNIPESFSKQDRKELLGIIAHGIEIYKVNCEKCHGKNYQSKEGPNFTQEQIRTYEAFLRMRDPIHEFTQKMSSDDIDAVIIFLKYKKH